MQEEIIPWITVDRMNLCQVNHILYSFCVKHKVRRRLSDAFAFADRKNMSLCD
jgi:hypothetical protein